MIELGADPCSYAHTVLMQLRSKKELADMAKQAGVAVKRRGKSGGKDDLAACLVIAADAGIVRHG